MKSVRKILLAVLLMAATSVLAQQNDHSKVEIKVIPVAGSVYMLTGAGGNIGVSVGDDGISIIDDQFAPLAEKIHAALKGISNRPVRFVIDTHWHGDHTSGNGYFQQQGPIIAQENVGKRLEEGSTVPGRTTPPAPKGALPIIRFNDRASVYLNGEEIRAIHFPHGHTDGDSVIFFTKSNAVHMGDDFVTYGFPFIDLDSGGRVQGMIAAVDKVIAAVPPETKVIPGHGPLSTVADLKPYSAMLEETTAIVQNGIEQGKTPDQMTKDKVLAAYQKWSGDFISTDKFIDTLYDDLTGKKPNELVKHN